MVARLEELNSGVEEYLNSNIYDLAEAFSCLELIAEDANLEDF